jgi:hypothetical protein
VDGVTSNKPVTFPKQHSKNLIHSMRVNIGLWTAIAIIGICGFSIVQGFGIVHFSLAMANINSSERRAEIVDTWSSTPDVASTALQADLTYQIDPSDRKAADRRWRTLSALVSIKPMSSFVWLALSGLQLITDQPMEQVFDSFELSMLTGPNEGHIIADRRLFGASLWGRLSPDLKRRVASDMAAGEIPYSDAFRAFVSAQPESVRNELREALIAAGLLPKEIEKRLGL